MKHGAVWLSPLFRDQLSLLLSAFEALVRPKLTKARGVACGKSGPKPLS